MLYSSEFYAVVRERLSDTGVLQQWFPGGEKKIAQAVVNTLKESFPYLLVCRSFEFAGQEMPSDMLAGVHLLASNHPLEIPTVDQAIERMPEAAKVDILEFLPGINLKAGWKLVLDQFVPVETMLPEDSSILITDDRPYNEYFWLRRAFADK